MVLPGYVLFLLLVLLFSVTPTLLRFFWCKFSTLSWQKTKQNKSVPFYTPHKNFLGLGEVNQVKLIITK